MTAAVTAADRCCPGTAGLTIPALLARLLPTITPVAGVESVPLRAARGRVLAEPLVSAAPVPAFARSAVDGYALRAADATAGRDLILPLVGRVAAGDWTAVAPVAAGAVRIFTGAAIPPGYDRVVMQEDCRELDGAVHIRRVVGAGDNIRLPGDDIAAGAVALPAGIRLDGRHLGVAASLGATTLAVRARPRVGVLSTGSELVEPGLPLSPGCIYASNGHVIAALLEQAGFEVVDLGVVQDDPARIDAAIASAARLDALVTSGGVSVGEEDHVRGAVERVGGRIDQWRLAIKPGKPVAVGRLPSAGGGQGALFIGLPGNPNAVFVTLSLIGLPLLRALAGQPQHRLHPVTVRAESGWRRAPGRLEFVSALLGDEAADGIASARRLGSGGSAQQCALGASDALLIIPAEVTEIKAGDLLQAYPVTSLI